jgi:hypothetical protein
VIVWRYTKHEPNEDQEINAGAKYYSRIYRTCLFEGNENAWRYQRVNRMKDTQYNGEREKGQNDKQRSTKHYTENYDPTSSSPLNT